MTTDHNECWIYAHWAMLPPRFWLSTKSDEDETLRPTEAAALQNIYQDTLLAWELRKQKT